MKIWIVTNAYLPEKGGLVSYTRNLALQLLKEGKEVEIITSNLKNTELPEFENIEGVSVKRVDYSNVPKLLMLFSPIVYYFRTKAYIKALQIAEDDIVISRFYSFALAVSKAKRHDRHIFITPLVATKLQIIAAKENRSLKKLYYYFILPQLAILDKLAIKTAPKVGVLSDSKRQEVVNYFKLKNRKVAVLPPGVDTNRFDLASDNEKDSLRKKLNYAGEDIILLCVSRLSSEKNLEILIRCMTKIEDKNVKLAFVGDGECWSILESLILKYNLQKRVKLWGARTNVEDYYKMADVFILPSKYEGFGHVYIEAMSCGLPCIAAKSNPPETITASGEIITDKKLGCLVDYNSEEQIIAAIFNCITNLGKNGQERRKHVLDNYTWEKHYKDIERIILNDRSWE
ncbi:glycosyltransferase family 4 protein [Ruminiclostridium cellobioparum]|uniref:Glycosyltransferase n=1 Tax=Ruminiclostridium cellobioparum subsp. termitidis CT1112 TaxID=1195236 RepID=S0FGQ7_RUMCE|nr:glycosyltransferase family 4 protein [Ruminiclostridium cellobioparum]EMS70347.1 Glycosyltransferase [Ruminiclostridium cellobioparum subsp. termitidis CT1112]